VAAAEARGELDDLAPSSPTTTCVYVGPFVDPERVGGARAASTRAPTARAALGQTCASATPNAGGSAARGRSP
jgi:hypothetical protein